MRTAVLRPTRSLLRRAAWVGLLAAVSLAAILGCGRDRGLKRTADRFLTDLVAEDYSAATGLCNAGLAQNLTPAKLKRSWALLRQLVGEFRRATAVHTETEGAATVAVITCEFERRTMDLRMTFDDQDKIGHLVFVSVGKKPGEKPAPSPKRPPPRGKKVAPGRLPSDGQRYNGPGRSPQPRAETSS